MKKRNDLFFLYGGLCLLFVAILFRAFGIPSLYFWVTFSAAISLKAFFLILTFRKKGFKPGLGLYLILAGVAMILISILFKTVYPFPVLRNILFYGAIALKVIGLLIMIFRGKTAEESET